MSTYQIGETPRLEAAVTNTESGAAADPTTITLNIVDPGEVAKVTDGAMTNPSTGSFYYDYTIPSDGSIGTWEWNVVATGSTGRVTIRRGSFEVEAKI